MRLLRVQVPEFRALKDVDISFEPDFNPQVFPLGSLNGGGKSTLLQLIFVSLHSFENPGSNYFNNITSELKVNNNEFIYNLVTITILLNNKKICLEYFYGHTEKINEFKKTKLGNNILCYYHNIINISASIIGIITFIDANPNIEIEDKDLYILKKEVVKKIFLISPSNQPYLFLSREERRLLFSSNPEKTYDQVLKGLKDSLPNFYTYDFIDVLTEVCRLERDKDFDEKLEKGIYGTHYEKLENAINSLFIDGKKIIPLTVQQKRHTKDSIQSMGFKLPSGEEIYPEDLSHGELKRLAIFVLIKYHEMQDSIVLIDEIENGFHLDWQYTIVRNLVEWGKNNQYILATHSYELCTAVTPAHVKEIEPKLTTK
jgi:Fe-S cluster assembly ATPase SufC